MKCGKILQGIIASHPSRLQAEPSASNDAGSALRNVEEVSQQNSGGWLRPGTVRESGSRTGAGELVCAIQPCCLAHRERTSAEHGALRIANARWLYLDGNRRWAGPLRRYSIRHL